MVFFLRFFFEKFQMELQILFILKYYNTNDTAWLIT